MKKLKRILSLALAACLLLSCAACGGEGEARAASMWLVKTEGTVSVTDGEGGDVSLLDRLGLFSGYGVATQAASFGWIDLGDTKLTKMDENSGVTVQKDGKHLELTVDRGALFFNVTRPLGDDESFEIRSSTMVTAIRGTCGWVEVPDADHMNVYILEGTVECSVGDAKVPVTAGQTAAIRAGESSITVDTFFACSIPAFVRAEVEDDEELAAAILDASGLDVLGGGDIQTALEGMGYIGDPAASTMTPEQAARLGETLQRLVAESEAEYVTGSGQVPGGEFHCYAALFDAGDGSPAVAFLNNGELSYDAIMGRGYPDYSGIIVLHFQDGQLVRMPNEGLDGLDLSDHYAVFFGYMAPDGSASDISQEWVYDLTAGGIHGPIVSQVTYDEYGPGGITIDGVPATQEQYSAWAGQWPHSGTGFSIGNGGFGSATGAQDASELAAALLAASGLDVSDPGPAGDPALLSGVYFGDPTSCTMTADQAAALAAALRSKMEKVEQDFAESRYKDPSSDGPRSFAALFDAGNGAPAMIFAGGQHLPISFEGEVQMISPYTFGIWHFPGGELAEFTDFDMAAVHDGWILVNGMWPDGSGYDGAALPLNGFIDADAPLASAHSNYYDGPAPVFQIDGADVSGSDFDAWTARWDGDAQVGVSHGSDIGAQCWGMAPAEDVLAALDAWAG